MRSIARIFAALALAASPAVANAEAPTAPSAEAASATTNDAGSASKTTRAPGATGTPAKATRASERPTATMPGFQLLDGGGSRLFVRLSSQVPVDAQKGKSSLTFVLKGAHVATRNNLRALETVHFNTPVLRARLVPKKDELLFVVELRADVTPTWKMTEEADKTSTLSIDFPSGNYLDGPAPAEAPSDATP